MATLAQRLERLELAHLTKSRRFYKIMSDGHSDEEIDEFLMASGIKLKPEDLLINIKLVTPAWQEKGPQHPLQLLDRSK